LASPFWNKGLEKLEGVCLFLEHHFEKSILSLEIKTGEKAAIFYAQDPDRLSFHLL